AAACEQREPGRRFPDAGDQFEIQPTARADTRKVDHDDASRASICGPGRELLRRLTRDVVAGDRLAAAQIEAERHVLAADAGANRMERVKRRKRLQPDDDVRSAEIARMPSAVERRDTRVEP